MSNIIIKKKSSGDGASYYKNDLNFIVSEINNMATCDDLELRSLVSLPGKKKKHRDDYSISEKELRDQLKALRDSQLKTTTKIKALISSDGAIDKICKYQSTIDEVSTQLGVPKEMIQSILYRELICYGLDDVAKDTVVRQYYISSKIKLPGTAHDLYNLVNLDDKVNDSSTGIGQIFAKTAIEAENEVNKNYKWNAKDEDDLWKMWKKLQDPKTNIYYIGLVLDMEAKQKNIELMKATREEKIIVLGRYNGNIDYGRQTIKYYDLFKKYNN